MSAQVGASVKGSHKNKVHRTKGDVIFDTVNVIIIALFLFIIIYPLNLLCSKGYSDAT